MDNIDKITLDVPLFIRLLEYSREDAKTDMDLHDVAENIIKLSKKNKVLGMSNYSDIVKTKKIKVTEQTMADVSGSFESSMTNKPLKRKISTISNFDSKEQDVDEITDASSSGAYDVPLFGRTPKGRKNPLKIDGTDSILNSRAVKDKNFPKWGGPGGKFIKIKDKCKKFPYCNQGDINAIETLRESIENISKKYGLPKSEIEKIVLNELKK